MCTKIEKLSKKAFGASKKKSRIEMELKFAAWFMEKFRFCADTAMDWFHVPDIDRDTCTRLIGKAAKESEMNAKELVVPANMCKKAQRRINAAREAGKKQGRIEAEVKAVCFYMNLCDTGVDWTMERLDIPETDQAMCRKLVYERLAKEAADSIAANGNFSVPIK